MLIDNILKGAALVLIWLLCFCLPGIYVDLNEIAAYARHMDSK